MKHGAMMHFGRVLVVILFSLSSELWAKRADVIVNDEIVPLGMLENILQKSGIEITLFKGTDLDVGELYLTGLSSLRGLIFTITSFDSKKRLPFSFILRRLQRSPSIG